MDIFKLIKDSFQYILLPSSDIKIDPADQQLWKCVRENKLRTLKDLFSSQQIHPNDYCIPESGHTFLHESIVTNRREIFKLCLLFHADVNRKDKNLWTPLMKATSLGRTQMISELLEKGADPYQQDAKGQNSFDKAIQFDRIEIFNMLTSHVSGTPSQYISEQSNIVIDENEKF